MKLLRDPIFVASMAVIPAAVIGFAPLIEYKSFVLPTLAFVMWGCMLLQVLLPKAEVSDLSRPVRAPNNKKIDKIAEQKFLLFKISSRKSLLSNVTVLLASGISWKLRDGRSAPN